MSGPAVAGVLSALFGPATVLAIDAATWLVYAACVHLCGSSLETTRISVARYQVLRFTPIAILSSGTLGGLFAMTMIFFFLYGPVEVALPILVSRDLGEPPTVLGAFWAYFGVGAVVGSFLLA